MVPCTAPAPPASTWVARGTGRRRWNYSGEKEEEEEEEEKEEEKEEEEDRPSQTDGTGKPRNLIKSTIYGNVW